MVSKPRLVDLYCGAVTATDYWEHEATDDDVWGGAGDTTEECVAAVAAGLTLEGSVLDYGCGPGRLALPIAQRYDAHVVGVDPCRRYIAAAQARTGQAHFTRLDCDWLPSHPQKFDAAYSVAVFQHLDGLMVRRALYDIVRSLKIGGRLRFQFVGGGGDEGPLNYRHGRHDVYGWCVDAGFAITDVDLGLVYPEWSWLTVERVA